MWFGLDTKKKKKIKIQTSRKALNEKQYNSITK